MRSSIKVDAEGADVVFSVRAVPGASSDKICGVTDGALRVRVSAPPREGKANKRLLKYLSKTLGIPAGRFDIAAGEKGRSKKIIIRGADRDAVEKKLAALCRETIGAALAANEKD